MKRSPLPQEILDKVALYCGRVRIAVALGACPSIVAAVTMSKRARIIRKLQGFLDSPLARFNGMGYRPDDALADDENEDELPYTLREDFGDRESYIGSWVILDRHRDDFVCGKSDAIRLLAGYSYNHYDRHWRYIFSADVGINPEDREECADEHCDQETVECLNVHATCILALVGYVVNSQGHVVGQNWTSGNMTARKPTTLLDLCPCQDT
jgi:hypothetical protein